MKADTKEELRAKMIARGWLESGNREQDEKGERLLNLLWEERETLRQLGNR